MPASIHTRIEIRDHLSDEEEVELIRIMNRHAEQVDEERNRSLGAAVVAVGLAIKFVLDHKRDIKDALGLAEDLINFLKKWRSKNTAGLDAHAPAQRPSGLILVVGPDQVPFDLTWASDEKIREYFCQHPAAK